MRSHARAMVEEVPFHGSSSSSQSNESLGGPRGPARTPRGGAVYHSTHSPAVSLSARSPIFPRPDDLRRGLQPTTCSDPSAMRKIEMDCMQSSGLFAVTAARYYSLYSSADGVDAMQCIYPYYPGRILELSTFSETIENKFTRHHR